MKKTKLISIIVLIILAHNTQASFLDAPSLRDFMSPPTIVSITADSGWHNFNVDSPRIAVSNSRPDDWRDIIELYGSVRSDYYWDKIFQFQLDRPALLTVVDVFTAIDRYEIYDNANAYTSDGYSYLFMTHYPDYYDGIGGTEDPDVVLSSDPNEHQSFGSIWLAPGFHSITGWEINHDELISPSMGAFGYIRIDSIPEPQTYTLILIGLLAYKKFKTSAV